MAHLRAAIVSLLALTVITGVVYPLIVTGIAQVVFPYQANGSLIVKNGKAVGSTPSLGFLEKGKRRLSRSG